MSLSYDHIYWNFGDHGRFIFSSCNFMIHIMCCGISRFFVNFFFVDNLINNCLSKGFVKQIQFWFQGFKLTNIILFVVFISLIYTMNNNFLFWGIMKE